MSESEYLQLRNSFQLENQEINDFILLEPLGHGSFGQVYKVQNTKDNTIYALKVILTKDMNLTDEEKIIAKLDSPYLIKYVDSFAVGFNYCILTEYCSGGDLRKKIVETKKVNSSLEFKIICLWCKEIIFALEYLHSSLVIHRDLKPENILLTDDEHVKVADFGISKEIEEGASYLTTMIGTRDYLSPEVFKGQRYNYKSDIWSAGCVLFEMITLERLASFVNKSLEEMDFLLNICVPEQLNTLLKMMLEIEPKNRPSSEDLSILCAQKMKFDFKLKEPILSFKETIENLKSIDSYSSSSQSEYTLPKKISSENINREKKFNKIKSPNAFLLVIKNKRCLSICIATTLMLIVAGLVTSGLLIVMKMNSSGSNTSSQTGVTLTNYWPMSNLSDVVGQASITEGISYSFVADRFFNQYSAIYVSQGYLRLPPGVYFSGDYTVTFWVYLQADQYNFEILLFGNNGSSYMSSDKVMLYITGQAYQIFAYNDGVNQTNLTPLQNLSPNVTTSYQSQLISFNNWYHVALVLTGTNASIYVSGSWVFNGTLNAPKNVNRTYCFLAPYGDIVLDDMKIYKGAMSSIQIINEYAVSSDDEKISHYNIPVRLQNYWPMSNTSDIKGGANIIYQVNSSYTSDRFNNSNQAVYLNDGYLQVPAGKYVCNEFTIIIWINIKSIANFNILSLGADFSVGYITYKVQVQLVASNNKYLQAGILISNLTSEGGFSRGSLQLNTWYHLAIVSLQTLNYIYVDGMLVSFIGDHAPVSVAVNRNNNFFGKSDSNTTNINAVLDEIRIYTGAMTANQVLNDYRNSSIES